MARRILLYGPEDLGFDPDWRVESRLIEHVIEPLDLFKTLTDPHTPARPEVVREIPPGLKHPPQPKHGVVHQFHEVTIRNAIPNVIEFEPSQFSPIEHEGLIYVIDYAAYLPSETFDIAFEQTESWDIDLLPIYVRAISR